MNQWKKKIVISQHHITPITTLSTILLLPWVKLLSYEYLFSDCSIHHHTHASHSHQPRHSQTGYSHLVPGLLAMSSPTQQRKIGDDAFIGVQFEYDGECIVIISSKSTKDSVRWRGTTPSMADFPDLRTLDLHKNRYITTLHSSVTILRQLKILDLAQCSRLQALPENIGDLSNLEVVSKSERNCPLGCCSFFRRENHHLIESPIPFWAISWTCRIVKFLQLFQIPSAGWKGNSHNPNQNPVPYPRTWVWNSPSYSIHSFFILVSNI